MEHPVKHYIKLNQFLLSITGLWPYQSVRNANIIRLVLTIILLSSAFFQLISALTSKITLEYIVDGMPILMPIFGGLFHMYARVIYINELRQLFDCISKDWMLKKTKDEIKIVHEYAETSRLLIKYFTLQVYLSMAGYFIWLFTPEIHDIISPLNQSRPRLQPFKINLLLDEERYCYLIRSHICITIVSTSLIFTASCTLFMLLTLHVCGMCALLGYRAERLFCVVDSAAKCTLIYETKISHKKIRTFIRLHQKIIKFVSIIENFHKLPSLMDCIGICFTLSLTLTQILTISGNIERAVRSISFSIVQMYYIFIYNYMGQKVTDMNWNIHDKLFNSMWYNTVISEQRCLILMMRQCYQPLAFTACKLYVLSLPNFGMIVQTAISYCLFLQSF